ncbi:MAG: hypothetical protein AB8B69_18195, partial [Chitinophagales bacterium]
MLSIITYGIIEGFLIAMVALAFQLSYSGLKMFDIGVGGLYVVASYLYIGLHTIFFPETPTVFSILFSTLGAIIGMIFLTLGIERFV